MTSLVYYFAFPHYRREILSALADIDGQRFEFVAGRDSRAGIAALGEGDVARLQIVPSFHVGPISWDRCVVRRAMSKEYDSVILGPATLSLSTWIILVIRNLLRRDVFLWGQCGRYDDRSLKRWAQEAMNRLATGILVYGENEAEAAAQLGLPRRKISVVRNSTRSNRDVLKANDDAEVLRRIQESARLATETGRLKLLFVGRLNASKRLDVLLSAASRLREQYPELEINIIGDGDARAGLSDSFPYSWVHFHGWIYDAEVLDRHFREATLVCSPYHMGLLAIDALRVGTPVLIPDNPTNGSEIEALTPMINSIRFAPGDASAIVAAANIWIESAASIDPAQYSLARRTALRDWDPVDVASAIMRSIDRRPARR